MKALLWDVDGTLAETERDGHRVAFNRAFEAAGLPWRWDEARYGQLLEVAGGRERILHDLAGRADAPASADQRTALASDLHRRKNIIYAELATGGGIPLRPGVRALMAECRTAGIPMGIATTTSRDNVAALLRGPLGPEWEAWFGTIVCGEDVTRKKPDPEVYHLALRELGVAAAEAVAVEDSPAGAAAARAAGVPVVITRSDYFAAARFDGALAVGPGFGRRDGWRPTPPPRPEQDSRVGLADIRDWYVGLTHVSSRR